MRIMILIISAMAWLPAQTGDLDWQAFDNLLREHVRAGHLQGVPLNTLDYPAVRHDPNYTKALRILEESNPALLQSKQEKLVFYINAYNLLAIKMVLDHWPIASIRDAGSWWQPVWKKDAGKIGGHTVSLHEIEHEILRAMGEPRIHMAIVCASISCPDLRAEAYRLETLEEQLDQQSRQFLRNRQKGARRDGNTLQVSKIFDWFEEDFEASGGIHAFIANYLSLPDKLPIETDIPYNWDLNYDNQGGEH